MQPQKQPKTLLFRKQNKNDDGEDPNGDYVWVIDPIDGTTNFVSGMPLSAISIVFCSLETKEVVVAVIYDPFRRETFHAIKGRGAFMDERKISVDNCSKIDDCLVATGYAPTEESSRFLLETTTNLTKYPVRSIRMLGSAAIMLAWVACGRVSCYIEESLNAWDTAAGALLVAEAGGVFTDFSGKVRHIHSRNAREFREHGGAQITSRRRWHDDDCFGAEVGEELVVEKEECYKYRESSCCVVYKN